MRWVGPPSLWGPACTARKAVVALINCQACDQHIWSSAPLDLSASVARMDADDLASMADVLPCPVAG